MFITFKTNILIHSGAEKTIVVLHMRLKKKKKDFKDQCQMLLLKSI